MWVFVVVTDTTVLEHFAVVVETVEVDVTGEEDKIREEQALEREGTGQSQSLLGVGAHRRTAGAAANCGLRSSRPRLFAVRKVPLVTLTIKCVSVEYIRMRIPRNQDRGAVR